MGNIGPGQLLLIALIVLLIFGAGRVAEIGKGLGAGIRNFKKGLHEDDEPGTGNGKETAKLSQESERGGQRSSGQDADRNDPS